jgi:hypothetical protein
MRGIEVGKGEREREGFGFWVFGSHTTDDNGKVFSIYFLPSKRFTPAFKLCA